MPRLFIALLLLVLAATARAEPPACDSPPAAMSDGWTTAKPSDVGLDPPRLCDVEGFLKAWPERNIHSVLVIRHGKLALERYFAGADERWGESLGTVSFAADTRHDVRSVSKSATSLLVGIALGEGKFPALDSSVFDAFPELADLKTPEKARITFRDLLTMSAGLVWDENRPFNDPLNTEIGMLTAAHPFRYILQQPMVATPGTRYAYSGGATSLLAEALVRRTGTKLSDYAREKLFAPLDVAQFDWDGVGVSRQLGAFGSLRLRPRDMAKLGQLMLTDGQWNGRRIIPAGWAAESSQPRLLGDGLFFYGYQWWLGRSLVAGREVTYTAAVGLGGQRVYIVPAFDLVVAITAGHYSGPLQSVITSAILNRLVLPALKD